MPRSMTGFGVARSEDGTHTFAVEVRSVNHRYCDVRTHLPNDLAHLSPEIEAQVRKRVRRGRVDITVSTQVSEEATVEPTVDLARARGYKAAYQKLAEALGLQAQLDLALIAQAPGVMRAEAARSPTDPKQPVLQAVSQGLEELARMREDEGAALATQLQMHLTEVRRMVAAIVEMVPKVNAERRRRLDERLSTLLGDNRLDPGRLAQEAALLADRADVTEEIERMDSHIEQFGKLLEADEPVGRKLDFLLQEMNREVNTVGSKSSDPDLAYLVVDLKTELERLREQVQNLE